MVMDKATSEFADDVIHVSTWCEEGGINDALPKHMVGLSLYHFFSSSLLIVMVVSLTMFNHVAVDAIKWK